MAKRLIGLATWKPSASYMRERPERADWRQLVRGEVQHVSVVAVERLAVGVGDVQRIDRVLGLVGAEPSQRNDGPLQVVVAVDAHRVGVHLPAVGDASQRRHLVLHQPADRAAAPFERRIGA